MRKHETQEPVNQRIVQVKKILKKSGTSLENITGLSASTISSYSTGRNKPGFDVCEAILRKCVNPKTGQELSPDWLMTGAGSMWKEEKNEVNEPQQEYFTRNYFDIRVLVERVRELERRVEELEKSKR